MRARTLIAMLVMVSVVLAACSSSQSPKITFSTESSPSNATVLAYFVPEKTRYAPGEPITAILTLTNWTSFPLTIDPYSSKIDVLPPNAFDPAVFSSSWGIKSYSLEPEESISLNFVWDQKDSAGKQVPSGWYNILTRDIVVWQEGNKIDLHPSAPRANVLIGAERSVWVTIGIWLVIAVLLIAFFYFWAHSSRFQKRLGHGLRKEKDRIEY